MMINYDVIVVGGGPAGLSAATVLGRSRRTVLVIDAGRPRNAPADAVHSFLSRDGIAPADLLEVARHEVARYGGQLRRGEAIFGQRIHTGFEITLGDGSTVTSRRLIVTTGLRDDLPAVPGLPELWGSDVVHCPHCHGWEVRDQAIGVLATGPMAVHQAMLFRQLSDDLTLFLHTAAHPSAEQNEQLVARGVRIVAGAVSSLETSNGRLTGVRLQDGTVFPRTALVVAPRAHTYSPLLDSLGVRPVPHPLGKEVGESYTADPSGASDLPGLWLAGNVTDLTAQVISSAAQGLLAAAAVNADLIAMETRKAVEQYRQANRS